VQRGVLVPARALPRRNDSVRLHVQRGRHGDVRSALSRPTPLVVRHSGGRNVPVWNDLLFWQLRERWRRDASGLPVSRDRPRMVRHCCVRRSRCRPWMRTHQRLEPGQLVGNRLRETGGDVKVETCIRTVAAQVQAAPVGGNPSGRVDARRVDILQIDQAGEGR